MAKKVEPNKVYSDKQVGQMVKRTERVPGSVLRRTDAGAKDVLKLQGRKPTRAGVKEVQAAVAKGKGGFGVLGGGKKRKGGGSKY